ncbi:hypothetical protein C900_02969 [Fulvivirga imtechensis AK7]|uniref:Uncharacterized protein n=1 Tax=Fulvivirga imtechensis AK7 TaxID=1237149 RepID=L8JQM4_9BACT|nr:hypothetical protein C900_02969 [Fulvivirga imtechensis AK7]
MSAASGYKYFHVCMLWLVFCFYEVMMFFVIAWNTSYS